MNQLAEIFTGEESFNAPATSDLLDTLLAQYRQLRNGIDEVPAELERLAAPVHYFLEGNKSDRYGSSSVNMLFTGEKAKTNAIAELNSAFWSKALSLTDVLEMMPQKRRDEWHEQISKKQAPEFEESTVRSTLSGLIASRESFFAERVDGIFRALSGEHVTNSPAGFSKRMIMAYVTDNYSYGNHSRCGQINDLRCVIAKFMGRDAPAWDSSNRVVAIARNNHGEWMIVDGGAMRIRVYMKGTAHLEIHPDMAYRLNQVLAQMYPRAIPSEFRTKPTRRHKEFQMMGRPLPFAVLSIIENLRRVRNSMNYEFGYGNHDKFASLEACRVLESIGATISDGFIKFDYDAQEVIGEIITSGCIPDQKSHQYYPTPVNIAQAAIELADIRSDSRCLEPSAGQGGLADLMPKARTYCVEISKLHSEILRAKGYQVAEIDFLKFIGSYDRIVMNPPYSDGRWQAHLTHASTMLTSGGVLVAILPASAKGKDVLPGMSCEWSRVYENEFAGTSVSVVILKVIV